MNYNIELQDAHDATHRYQQLLKKYLKDIKFIVIYQRLSIKYLKDIKFKF